MASPWPQRVVRSVVSCPVVSSSRKSIVIAKVTGMLLFLLYLSGVGERLAEQSPTVLKTAVVKATEGSNPFSSAGFLKSSSSRVNACQRLTTLEGSVNGLG
jgi:hypothetical protein